MSDRSCKVMNISYILVQYVYRFILPYECLSVCIFICLPASPSILQCDCPSARLSVCLSAVCLSVCLLSASLSNCPSMLLSVSLSVCFSIILLLYKCLYTIYLVYMCSILRATHCGRFTSNNCVYIITSKSAKRTKAHRQQRREKERGRTGDKAQILLSRLN